MLRETSAALATLTAPLEDAAGMTASERQDNGRDLSGEAKRTEEMTGRPDVMHRLSTMMVSEERCRADPDWFSGQVGKSGKGN